MARISSPFTTIRSEGALLPPELLTRIAEADKDLGGLAPTDYHLGETERLGEAISRSWNRLVGVWASFEASMDGFSANDPGTGQTRERWLAPLFQELGFGRLQVAKAREIDGTDYAISHEWGEVPIHLVGAGVELERRTKGVAGAAKMSPHALVQDYLNRTVALWGIVSNGRELRLLRDNVSFTRQAFLAFDVEAMFSGEVYADFALLWLTCHESRLEPQDDKTEGCWLERWTQAAQTQGTRALNTLREGVETAISKLGAGFVAHPSNSGLREDLRSGELAIADYYRELLRLIYRLIFLFVAEDRTLLHPVGTSVEARARYQDYYSMTRLRRVAERMRGGPHPDLWRSFVFVCSKLASDEGCEELGLPFLGSALFSPRACPHLDGAELANQNLLGAVRALAFTEQGRVLRQIDYRNMGSEELGSIYESLLELHPEVHHESGSFTLATAPGNERKTTGSYYTPTSLISALLDSSLDPVLEEAAAKPEAETAILDLKVLDPAAGSGHFLVAAAHRIAKRLAAIRADEPEPSSGAYRAALRDVISRCIFGIDVNPMATELCKVSLWMEAVEPGKPLSFLEHHVVCGNSLLGTTPALLAQGIPDEAFTALEGDDKETVKSLKKRNKEERKGQASLLGEAAHPNLVGPIATRVAALEATQDDSPEALHAKQQAWDALEASDQVAHAKLIADAWCAAFMAAKAPDSPVLTQGVLELLERHPQGGDPELHAAIRGFADHYRFLHPHLAFPQVFHTPSPGETPDNPDQGWSGGFDVVLGNPPWERAQFEERAFFAARGHAISEEPNKAKREKAIDRLREEDATLYEEWHWAKRRQDAEAALLRRSGRFPRSAVDKFNLYAVFFEAGVLSLAAQGRLGMVVKAGLVTDKLCSPLFRSLFERKQLASVFEFENSKHIFPAVHRQERFVLATVASGAEEVTFVFDATQVSDILDPARHLKLTATDLATFSPVTGLCPKFENPRSLALARTAYGRIAALAVSPPAQRVGTSVDRYINVSDFSSEIVTARQLPIEGVQSDELVPIYEGKLIWQFDSRYATYPASASEDQPAEEVVDKGPDSKIRFLRYIPRSTAMRRNPLVGEAPALLVCRDITNRTNERGVVAAIIPSLITDYTLRVWRFSSFDAGRLLLMVAGLNSFAFDYLARQRIGGSHLSNYILEELPAPIEVDSDLRSLIVDAAFELSFTGRDLEVFARSVRPEVNEPFQWNEERRDLLRAEIDAAFFRVYGLEREDVEYVMDQFPVYKRRDEHRNGEYRTKQLILDRFDTMADAAASGHAYMCELDPPPADPRVTHAKH